MVLPSYLWWLIAVAAVLTLLAALSSQMQMPRMFGHMYAFVAHEPNPIMQAVYCSLVMGIFWLYIQTAFPVISDFHRRGAWMAVLTTLGIFAWACLSHPTVVTRRNEVRLAREYEPDGIVYPLDERQCETCNVKRFARSKHCSVCNHCVAGFDHHCVWLNVCISQSNKFHFLAFLVATVLLCLYCIVMCVDIVMRLGVEKGLLEEPIRVGQFLKVFILQGGIYFSMALMTIFCGLGVFIFFAWHFRLAMRNETTNEYVKRRRYRQIAKKDLKELRNPYDKGVVRNLTSLIAKTRFFF